MQSSTRPSPAHDVARSHLGAPLRIGVAFGLAAFVLGALDLLSVARRAAWLTAAGQDVLRFAPRILIALPLTASALSCLLAVWIARSSSARMRRRMSVAVCALPLLACVPALFGGPSISASPWRVPLLIAALTLVLGLVTLVLRTCSFALGHLPASDATRALACGLAISLALAVPWAAAHVSQRVLHGLYPLFHLGIALGALGASAAAWMVALEANSGPPKRHVRASAFAVLAGALAVTTWGATLTWCLPAASARSLLTERAPFTATLVPLMFAIDVAADDLTAPSLHVAATYRDEPTVSLASARFSADGARPHVVLMTVDALRGDVLRQDTAFSSCAPRLQAIARRNVDFVRAYSVSNTTVASLPATLTGIVRANAATPRASFLPVVLAHNGYDTAAWVTQHEMTEVDSDLTRLRRRGFHFNTYDSSYVSAARVAEWARQKLRSATPRFVWLHLSDVHEPYKLPRSARRPSCTTRDEYGHGLAEVDAALGDFIEELEARDDVVWALTADHGESRGERGVYGHDSNLYDEQVRVPLVLGGPGVASASVETPVTVLDLAMTLLQMAGAALPEDAPRLPWREASRGRPSRPAISYGEAACAITQDHLKLVADARVGAVLLFDLRSDPDQRVDVAPQHRARTHTMFRALTPPLCPASVGRLSRLLPPNED